MSAHGHRIYHRLQLAAHEMKKSADRAVRDTGLTTAQIAVLVVVRADQPVAQRRVAEQLGLNESAVTAMVRRLVDLGLVERSVDQGDARVRLLVATAAGEAALQRAEASFAAVNDAIDRAIDPAEIEVLAGLLDRLRRHAS